MTEPRDDEATAATDVNAPEKGAAPGALEATSPEAAAAEADSAPAATDNTTGALSEGRARVRALEPRQIRARRRPGAVLFVWAWELLCAFFIATPVHAFAKAVWGNHPDGDAVIFRPGGRALLTWLGDEGPALAVVFRTTFLLLVLFGVLGQIITGALAASLATGIGKSGRAPSMRFALRAGGAAFFPLLAVCVIAGAFQAFLVGVGMFLSSSVDHGLQASSGDARAFTMRLVVLAPFVLGALLVGVVADLARVAIARDVALADGDVSMARRLRDGIVAATTTARCAIGRASLAWGWRAAASLALVWCGALAGDAVGGRGDGALWLLFGAHQLIVLARAGLRASWFANSLRLVLDR
jgi:hypothetical protein